MKMIDLFAGFGGFSLAGHMMGCETIAFVIINRYLCPMSKPKYYYRIIHSWLNKHYGKADKCESETCNSKSKNYEYCLKKGYNHDRNRDHYIMFCRSCHRKYDMTNEIRQILLRSAGKFNENLALGSKAKKRKIILDNDQIFDSGKELADHLGVNKSSIYMVANGQRKTIKGHIVKYENS